MDRQTKRRNRMIAKAKEYQISTYVSRFVAPVFQTMVRAEAGVGDARVPAVVRGEVMLIWKANGECVCVTCGKRASWQSGLGGMHTGHFLGGRRLSILLEEDNCAPQCCKCNVYESGAADRFHLWMLAVRGEDVIQKLTRLKASTRSCTREELVDLRISFQTRLDNAMKRMKS